MANILLINHYASTPSTGIGGRHHNFARELANLGHSVTLIAASDHHLLRKDIHTLVEEEQLENYRFIRLKVPKYDNAHDKRRLLAWLTFSFKLLFIRRFLKTTPDVILYSSPHLFGFLSAEYLAKRWGSRLVFEVRDIWPLSIVEIGNVSKRNPFITLMQYIEDRAYARADHVVSNLEFAVEHMVTRNMDRGKFSWVSNGISLREISASAPLQTSAQNYFLDAKFCLVYSGTLGEANAVHTLIEAAAYLRDLDDCKILIIGQGRSQANLQARCSELQLKNVKFIGYVPKNRIFSFLKNADATYIGFLKKPIYRFGVSPNKLFEYLVVGKPIIYGIDDVGVDPVTRYDAGLTVPAEDPEALANAIRTLYNMSDEHRRPMGENAKNAAIAHFTYEVLAKKLEKVLIP